MFVHGYDSIAVAVGQRSEPVGGWHLGIDYTDGRHKWLLNTDSIQCTRNAHPDRPDVETRVQCSLPKLLYGENAGVTLNGGELVQAVQLLDEHIHRFWPDAAPVEDLLVRRLDVTADRQLPSEAHVRQVLTRLTFVERRGKAGGDFPVRGSSGSSVSWPRKRGGVTYKAYSKAAESLNVSVEGLLRVEAQANGNRAVSRFVAGADEQVTVGTALASASVAVGILGGLPDLVERAVRGVVGVVKALDAVERFRTFPGRNGKPLRSDRVAALLGYAYVLQQTGGDWARLGLNRQNVYQVRRDYQAFMVDPLTIDFGEGGLMALAPVPGSEGQMVLFDQEGTGDD